MDGSSSTSASFSLCLKVVQGNMCDAQEGAGVTGTIWNVGRAG